MTTSTLRKPANTMRIALALTAASALAGGAWVAEAHPEPSHNLVLNRPATPPKPRANVSPTSYAITGTTTISLQGYSRTSSATPLA